MHLKKKKEKGFWLANNICSCSQKAATSFHLCSNKALPHGQTLLCCLGCRVSSFNVCILYVLFSFYKIDFIFCCFSFPCRVLQSKNAAFPVGSYVVGRCGWRTHTVCDGTGLTSIIADWPQDVSLSLALGTIGMPG